MSKHTPGPWKWIDTEFYGDPLEGPNKNCLVGPPADPDCKPYATDSSDHVVYFETPIENEANACLISAAPDLLEALKECIDRACTTRGEWVPLATMKKMQAAIAKAEGRE